MFATLLPLTLLATSLARASPLEDRRASSLEEHSTSPLQKRAGICDSAPLDAPAVEISQHGDGEFTLRVRQPCEHTLWQLCEHTLWQPCEHNLWQPCGLTLRQPCELTPVWVMLCVR